MSDLINFSTWEEDSVCDLFVFLRQSFCQVLFKLWVETFTFFILPYSAIHNSVAFNLASYGLKLVF